MQDAVCILAACVVCRSSETTFSVSFVSNRILGFRASSTVTGLLVGCTLCMETHTLLFSRHRSASHRMTESWTSIPDQALLDINTIKVCTLGSTSLRLFHYIYNPIRILTSIAYLMASCKWIMIHHFDPQLALCCYAAPQGEMASSLLYACFIATVLITSPLVLSGESYCNVLTVCKSSGKSSQLQTQGSRNQCLSDVVVWTFIDVQPLTVRKWCWCL